MLFTQVGQHKTLKLLTYSFLNFIKSTRDNILINSIDTKVLSGSSRPLGHQGPYWFPPRDVGPRWLRGSRWVGLSSNHQFISEHMNTLWLSQYKNISPMWDFSWFINDPQPRIIYRNHTYSFYHRNMKRNAKFLNHRKPQKKSIFPPILKSLKCWLTVVVIELNNNISYTFSVKTILISKLHQKTFCMNKQLTGFCQDFKIADFINTNTLAADFINTCTNTLATRF